jgi:hypothetical protein
VRVANVNALTEQWMEEFTRLRKLNAQILRTGGKPAQAGKPNALGARPTAVLLLVIDLPVDSGEKMLSEAVVIHPEHGVGFL